MSRDGAGPDDRGPVDADEPTGAAVVDGRTDEAGRRVADAMAAFGDQVRPDPGGWGCIDARLADAPDRRLGQGAARGPSTRRPVLVAAAFVVVLALVGAVVVQVRTADTGLEVATAPSGQEQLGFVALTDDGRLVELDIEGHEQREIHRNDGGGPLVGPIAVSPLDNTIYLERQPQVHECVGVGYSPASVRSEIVAIPFAGGETRVVAPVGATPSLQPRTGRLAYLKSAGEGRCDDGSPYEIGVADPVSGATRNLSLRGIHDGPAGDGSAGAPLTVDLPFPDLIDVRWSADDDALWVLANYGSGVPYRALIRIGLRFGNGAIVADQPQIVLTGVPSADADLAGSILAATAFDSVETGPGGDATFVFGRADADGTLDVARTVASGDERSSWATTVEFGIDAGALDLAGARAGVVDHDARSGRVLAVVLGNSTTNPAPARDIDVIPSGPPEVGPSPASDSRSNRPTVFTASISPLTGALVAGEGSQSRVVANRVVSAAWVWSGTRLADDAPGPTEPVEVPDPTVSEPIGTTVPPDAGQPDDGARSDDEPSVPPTAGAGRPDDAAGIGDAFVAFFSHGDRSALEGSGVLEPSIQEGAESVPEGGVGVTVTITAIRFTGTDEAEVDFLLDQSGRSFTAPTRGTAVRLDGRWLVSAATMCILLGRVQIPCPVTE